MPTHEEKEATKAHFKKVDSAQESILEAMFNELRNESQGPSLEDTRGKREKN